MAKVRSWAGLDVHARSVLAVTLDAESGEIRSQRLPGETAEVVEFLEQLPGPTRAAYEAGPTGYGLARALHASGIGCVVAAPGRIERPAQDKIKTDLRDAERVLRLLMIDGLHPVRVPTVEEEALRDLVRAREDVPGSPWAQTIARLRCLRGIDTLSAVGLAAEIGDFERFDRPGKLMSYLGLVPSEASSGQTRRQGAITKTGSSHARRLLVEAAWHYRKTPARGVTLQRRQDGQRAHVVQISWQAQQRLHRVWQRQTRESISDLTMSSRHARS